MASFVNAWSADGTSSVPSQPVPVTNQNAGDLVVVGVNWSLATSALPSVTDTAGNIYKLIRYRLGYNSSASNVAYYYCLGINAASSNTITATFSASSTFTWIGVIEWSGVSGILDGGTFSGATDSFANSVGPANSGNITTSVSGDILIGFAVINGLKFSAVGSGWTQRNVSTNNKIAIMDQVAGAAGTYAATATLSATQLWDAFIIGFTASPVVTASPAGGIFDQPTLVSLSCSTPNSTIHYTTDGTTPTSGSPTYTGPFVVGSNLTVKTYATASGIPDAAVTSYQFSIGGQIISTNTLYDNSGNILWAVNPYVFKDPVSNKWYLYGSNDNQPGVYQNMPGINVYSSADLRNWTYVTNVMQPAAGAASTQYDRFHVLYNAANNNYVAWARRVTFVGTTSTVYGPIAVFTSSSPTGPFTLSTTFSTLHSLTTGGDIGLFQDSNGTDAYLIWVANGNGTINIDKLAANWLAVDGVNFQSYTNTAASPFGQTSEAPIMVKQGSTYFWMCSGSSSWTANACLYVTGSSPLGPWTLGGNPFQTATVPQTPQEAAISVTPAVSNSYDTQCVAFVQIPGRNGVYYLGDRYDLTIAAGNSGTASFQQYQTMILPVVFPTSTSMTITWSNNWTFDGAFATVSGAPAAATGLAGNVSTLSWTNNETNPYALYLDRASDSGFTSNVVSRVLAQGTTSLNDTNAVVGNSYYYRVRTVNANGTTNSSSTFFTITSGMVNSALTLQSFLYSLPPGDTVIWQGLQWQPGILVSTLAFANDSRLQLRVAVSGTSTTLLNADGSTNSTPLTLIKRWWGYIE